MQKIDLIRVCFSHAVALFILAFASALIDNRADAGLLVAPHLSLGVESFRPVTNESTNASYTRELGLSFGYSFAQVFDFAVRFDQAVGAESTRINAPVRTRHAMTGLELGLRISEVFYVGLRAGESNYRQVHKAEPDDIDGQWSGIYAGLAIGLVAPIKRNLDRVWQITLDAGTNSLTYEGLALIEPESTSRVIDQVRLTLTYVYNSSTKVGLLDSFASSLFEGW